MMFISVFQLIIWSVYIVISWNAVYWFGLRISLWCALVLGLIESFVMVKFFVMKSQKITDVIKNFLIWTGETLLFGGITAWVFDFSAELCQFKYIFEMTECWLVSTLFCIYLVLLATLLFMILVIYTLLSKWFASKKAVYGGCIVIIILIFICAWKIWNYIASKWTWM